MSTIVICLDGSEAAAKAAELGLGIASARGDHVVMLAVQTPMVELGVPEPLSGDGTWLGGSHMQELADTAAASARARGVDVETVVTDGRPAEEICRLARDRAAGLIVVGGHGWGPIRSLIEDSAASAVLHRAPCAVLVGPPGSRDQSALEAPAHLTVNSAAGHAR